MHLERPLASFLLAASAALAACTTDNPGITPRSDEFHYPIAGAVSPDGRYLYVVNSDFDLRYSGGGVLAVDLDRVRAAMASGAQRPANEAPFLVEGPFGSVRINPFATAAALGRNGTRLYITVRGDGTLTWVDVAGNGAELRCGQSARGELCDDDHRRGQDPEGNPRALTMPPLPVTLDVGNDGYIAVAHQESPRARVSLFLDDPCSAGAGPVLAHYIGDLTPSLTALLRVNPTPAEPRACLTMPSADRPHWYAFSRNVPTVDGVRAVYDGDRSFLYRATVNVMPGLAPDVGVRAVARDPRDPRRAFATARPRPPDSNTAARSGDQLMALRLPDPAVGPGPEGTPPETPVVTDVLDLPPGPSNLVAVDVADESGARRTRVYVVSYDARKVYVIDADEWREVAQIRTEGGPHALVVDPLLGRNVPGHDVIYLLDFQAMVVEVIDVRANRVVFTIGDVVLPQGSL